MTPEPLITYLTKYSGECESELRSNEHYLSSSENKSWKKCRPVWDLNTWPLRYQYSARPAKLTVIGSNPVQAWIFCLNSAQYGEDLFHIHFFIRSLYIYDFHIFPVIWSIDTYLECFSLFNLSLLLWFLKFDLSSRDGVNKLENDRLLAQRQVERKLCKRPSTISSWV